MSRSHQGYIFKPIGSKQGWMRGAAAAEERVLTEPMTYGIAPASKTQSSGPDGRKLNDRDWKLERPLPLIDRQCADPSLLFPVRMILHDERGRKLRELGVSDSWAGRGPLVQPREALRAQDSTLAGRFETCWGGAKGHGYLGAPARSLQPTCGPSVG